MVSGISAHAAPWQLSHLTRQLSQCVQNNCALLTQKSALKPHCRRSAMTQGSPNNHALTTIKGHYQTGFSKPITSTSVLSALSIAAGARWAHHSGGKKHPPQLDHQNHLAPSFHKHDGKPPTALTSVGFSFKGTVRPNELLSLHIIKQGHAVGRLVFSSFESTGSRCSFKSPCWGTGWHAIPWQLQICCGFF